MSFLFVIWLFLPKILPNIQKQIDNDFCLDTGICKEGFKVKNEDGIVFIINKENCLKYGHEWYEDDKSCNLRKTNN